MEVRLIRTEENLRTEELFSLAFEIPMERSPDWKPDEALHWAAFDDDGEMMSTLTVSDFTVNFDGHGCKMGGIGGVATLPQYRRRGGIRGCFAAFLPELSRRGYDFSYLYPFSTCFYRQFGYENCVVKQNVRVDLSQLKRRDIGGSYRLAEPGRDLRSFVREIDQTWEMKYNMAVRHSEDYYDRLLKLDPAVKQAFCYVWFRADGTPGAYTVYRRADEADGRNLRCSKFVFSDPEGFHALLQLFRAQASNHRYVKFPLPDDGSLRYLLPEWSLGAASWETAPAGMVRVIRVREVLEKAACLGSGDAVLQIEDPWIEENDGSFRISFEDGKVLGVQKTDCAPDVKLTIPAFSALIAGTCDFADARKWMEGIEVLHENPALEQLFHKKPLFISDYF